MRHSNFCFSVVLLCSLLPLAACGGGSSSSNVTPPPSVSVSIASAPASIGAGANWQYSATVTGSSNQAVTWSASGGGTIDANTGVYIAPNTVPNPATVTITANAAAGATASATLKVLANDPLGTVSSSSQLSSCAGSLQGGTCYQLAVSCPGASDISVYLKVLTPSVAPVGTVLFGVGTGGSGLYDDPNSAGYAYGSNVVQSVLNAGYNTVQVSFGAPFNSNQSAGWLQGPGGVRRLACRYATVADWVYKNPKAINPNVGASVTNSAPMCATGNSGGSAAIAYAVYEYGLNSELAMVEPTSGPVMTRIDLGCSPCSSKVTGQVCSSSTNTHPEMCYESADAAIVDQAYSSGQNSGSGPCTSALNGNPGANAAAIFQSDSILYQGQLTINIANTRMKQLLADDDTSNAVPQATTWQSLISPAPTQQCMAGVQHDMPSFSSAATQISSDIINNCH